MNTKPTNTELAELCARGSYQRDLLNGKATLGGSTLKGTAKAYSGKYAQSAKTLLSRLDKAGVKYHIELGPRGGWYSATIVLDE